MNTRSHSDCDPGRCSERGIVASMIGTAPRRPAHDRSVFSLPENRNGMSESHTDIGRATNVRTAPSRSAGTSMCSRFSGDARSPSMTNMPSCATQPRPLANDCVAARCGSREFPRTSAARYAAMNPDAWSVPAAANAAIPRLNTASGYRPDTGSARRRSSHAPPAPTASPITDPAASSHTRSPNSSNVLGRPSAAENARTRITAGASLNPDSASRVPLSRLGSPMPRSSENTAAASVDATTAPMTSAVCHANPSR
nr:hypothetical protein GCM10025732_26930 [Glycomyces mayteni]